MLQWKIFRSKWTALAWFILMSILFVIPGSALPHDNWFSKVYFDKWVHIGLFAGLVFLWRSAFEAGTRHYNGLLLLGALLYGCLVEVVQREWVPYRDFDVYDIAADMTGSLLGLGVWLWVYKKNKPL